jgi:hypothetical protein
MVTIKKPKNGVDHNVFDPLKSGDRRRSRQQRRYRDLQWNDPFRLKVNSLCGFFSSPAVSIPWEAESRPCRYPGTTPGLTNRDKRLTDYVKALVAASGNDEIYLIDHSVSSWRSDAIYTFSHCN